MVADLPAAETCPECATEWGRGLLACPGCQRLVHGDALRVLAEEAENAARAGDAPSSLASWRRALELLPIASRQHAILTEKVVALSREVERTGPASGAPAAEPRRARWIGTFGVLGGLLVKFKFVVFLVLSKAKLLLLGLTKLPTLLTAVASFGVYWTAWGWRFALGLVAAMYVHEMGHVFALRRFGIGATAPMFVPGLGAFVRMEQYPVSAREDARVGLAGPTWGLAAAAAACAGAWATGWPALAAVARTAAWLNLFNLLPLGSLDGGRGFRSLSRVQQWAMVGCLTLAWGVSHEGILGLLVVVSAFRASFGRPAEPDHGVLAQFAFLVIALTGLCVLSARHAIVP
jgi:Zn-dependent protease